MGAGVGVGVHRVVGWRSAGRSRRSAHGSIGAGVGDSSKTGLKLAPLSEEDHSLLAHGKQLPLQLSHQSTTVHAHVNRVWRVRVCDIITCKSQNQKHNLLNNRNATDTAPHNPGVALPSYVALWAGVSFATGTAFFDADFEPVHTGCLAATDVRRLSLAAVFL